ncbi:MAG: 23S rRNA (adenine(2503)-C(2))-methyltransferase RlmN, partial [Candidatus Omnitrophota bacterium]
GLYRKGARDIKEMRGIPVRLRDSLSARYRIGSFTVSDLLKSRDGTEKALFRLNDGRHIETVLIRAAGRKTVCISTQVGCKFACPFCASGQKGFFRNLTVSEIVGQITYFRLERGMNLTNYVFMGMGEPLDNFENLSRAIKIMNDPHGLDIGARRITVSTSGIVPGIERLEGLGLQVNLSISLHAANDELRNRLVPVNKIYNIERLVKACGDYFKKTGRIVTLEYVLLKGLNDTPPHADRLAALAKKISAIVNLIPYSDTHCPEFSYSGEKAAQSFAKKLLARHVRATIRDSKGKDIEAACGQLALKSK